MSRLATSSQGQALKWLPLRPLPPRLRIERRIRCCACLSYLAPTYQYPDLELARKALTASLSPGSPVHGIHHALVHGAPNSATIWFTTVCALSVALAALIFNLFSILATWQMETTSQVQKRHVLHGVDVTNSRFFRDERVLAAVEFAAVAHAGQVRKTGEPYVSHCLETALIVEHNLPPASEYERYALAIIAALLHDVVDDTSVELSAIKAKFGIPVAAMVAQVSKLSQMNQLLRRGKRKGWAEYGPQHFKSLRKMIVDMVFEEPLVILIKLADRLHNMRTVFVLKPDKQKAVAEETLEVWCTMAECLGWDALKSEMEDLCFAVLQPEQYCALRVQLDRIWSLPSLKVVVDQADSSSLPANALAPAPPFSPRGRRVAAASAARKAAAAARAAMQALVPAAAAHMHMASPLQARDVHAGARAGSAVALQDGDSDLNLGIRIVATPRGGKAEGENAGPMWDLVNWTMDMGKPEVRGAPAGTSSALGMGVASGRHTHPDVLLQAWAGTLPNSAVQEVTAATVAALVASDANALQGATTTLPQAEPGPSKVDGRDDGARQAHLLRIQSHGQAGPGPASSGPGTSQPASSSVGGRLRSAAITTQPSPAPALPAPAASGARTATLARPAPTTLLTADEIEAVLASEPTTYTSIRSSAPKVTTSSSSASSTSSTTTLAPVLYTQEQLSAGYPMSTLSSTPSSRTPPRPAASPTASSNSGSAGTTLMPQQERLRSLISTVVPFDSVNFKDTRLLAMSTRKGLEVLDECAELLFAEVQLRSSGGGLSLQIQGRLKSLNSVYRKMVRKGCSVAEVYDARALRVIVGDDGGARNRDGVEACYKLVSTVHSIWKPIPQEFDDYIANPKPSGYQALHTAVKGPGGIPMEVQIKTSSMHELAEYGAAAHWVYKEYAHSAVMLPITPAPVPPTAPITSTASTTSTTLPTPTSSTTLPTPTSSTTLPSSSTSTIPTTLQAQAVAQEAAAPSASQQPQLQPALPVSPSQQPQPAQSQSGSSEPTASISYPPPVERLKGRGWRGQPVLRVAKDKLRYGVIVGAEMQGKNLLVAVKSGPTSQMYPIRIPDYAFYRGLMEYVQAKNWRNPGHSDFNVRLEEFVFANDGRFHRKDHMGYVLPGEVITLLEGYEEDADAADRAAAAKQAAAGVAAGGGAPTETSSSQPQQDQQQETQQIQQQQQQQHALDNVPQQPALLHSSMATTDSKEGQEQQQQQQQQGPSSGSSSSQESAMDSDDSSMPEGLLASTEEGTEGGSPVPVDPAAERLRRQMQEAYLRTQQLRTMIEWGRAAMGRYHQGGSEPGDEVSVLVWPGGTIEHWPRGTTVAQLVRAKGIITLSALPEPPDIRPSATAVAGGDDGWMYAREGGVDGAPDMNAAEGGRRVPLVNVNNRLVREDSVLNDGDLVILAREKVKI